MSFPRSVGQVPLHYNHLNTGRPQKQMGEMWTSGYLDSPASPAYPFGYGLSYTSFSYSDIKLSANSMNNAGSLTATLTVTNPGNYDGEEVVQLYIRDMVGSIARPMKELKAFKKILLKKGESKQVSFTIGVNDLKFYNNDLKLVAEPGDFKILIGGNSRDVKEVDFKLQ